MSSFVPKDCYVKINNIDLSDHVTDATLTVNGEQVDDTGMGAGTTYRCFLTGLLNWSLEVEFKQDYESGKVDATLWPLMGASAFTVEYRPRSGSRSGTNPAYTGSALLEAYPVISNRVGEMAKSRVVFRGSGTLSRLTS
jgi:hypothetical protein